MYFLITSIRFSSSSRRRLRTFCFLFPIHFLTFILLYYFFHQAISYYFSHIYFFTLFFLSGNAAFFAAYTQTKILVLKIGENKFEKNRNRREKKQNFRSYNKNAEYSSEGNLGVEDSVRSIRNIEGKGSVRGSVDPNSCPVEDERGRGRGRGVRKLENKIDESVYYDSEADRKLPRESNNNKAVLLAGAMAGLAYVLSSHPLEIASILMQTDVPIKHHQYHLTKVVQKLKMKKLPEYR